MTGILKNTSVRELASQRTVSLYRDQEELIEKLNTEYGTNIKVAKLVREGVDLALRQIYYQLKETQEGDI